MSSADCRNIYLELFSTDMIYRHLLSTESGGNLEFNCAKVIQKMLLHTSFDLQIDTVS